MSEVTKFKKTHMQNLPEYHEYDEFKARREKLKELRALGIDPYPAFYEKKDLAEALQKSLKEAPLGTSEEAASGSTQEASLSGRIVLFRAMGKNAFAQIQDESGRIQVMFNRDDTKLTGYKKENPEALSPFKIIEKKFDLGDIIGVKGHLFRTQKGELTLYVKEATLLCKTLLPLADKHSGLEDKELRYRKRWLDLISNQDVKEFFKTRSRIIQEIRAFFHSQGFMEVETPILQGIYGGAEARPFKTTLNALDQEMFLRISLEIPLKKLIVGGFDRVFELGKVFRNEGIDRNHNPEFTLLEAYAANADYNTMMVLVETLFEKIALAIHGTTKVFGKIPATDEVVEIDFKAPWKRLTMKESIETYANLVVDHMSDAEIRELLKDSGHCDLKKLANLSRGLLIAALFEVKVEPHLIQPHHIIDHPLETTPLCKLHRNPKEREEGLVERFESFILSQEVCNSYTELNDPEFQRELLETQAKRRDMGDEEASPLDEEFIEAICQGMPPTGGLGIGIDRLIMLMTGVHSIRDALFFPWMKG